MQARKKISYSWLSTMNCSYRNFLRYEGGLKGPTTPWLAKGQAIHFALERAFKLPEGGLVPIEDTVKNYLTEFNRIVQEEDVFITFPQLKKMQTEGVEMIEMHYDQVYKGLITDKPLAVELEFTLPIENIEITGKIDRLDEDETGFVVTDYKSGKKPDPWLLTRDLQFSCYAWAIRELKGKLPYKIVFHHLPTGEMFTTTRSEWDIDQLKKLIRDTVTMQEQNIRSRIYNQFVCKYCDFSGEVCDNPLLEQEILDKKEERERRSVR